MSLPQLRRRLSQRLQALGRTVESLDLRHTQLHVSIYRHRIRCGKPGCHCAKDPGHLRTCLSFSSERGRHTRTLSPAQERQLAPDAEAYRNYRKTRAEAVGLWLEILDLIDSIAHRLERRVPASYRRRKR